jgi:hypothetical protein
VVGEEVEEGVARFVLKAYETSEARALIVGKVHERRAAHNSLLENSFAAS